MEPLAEGIFEFPDRNDYNADWDCEWEEAPCPVCGRLQDQHTSQQMTRCATNEFNSRSYA